MIGIRTPQLARILICGSVFLFLCGTIPMSAAAEPDSSREITISGTALVTMAVPFLAHFITPLPKWQKEIQKLKGDELFVQRWMLLNNDDASLAKGERALEKIHTQRKSLEKKQNRFMRWFYPVVVVAGTGIGLLTVWLKGGVS